MQAKPIRGNSTGVIQAVLEQSIAETKKGKYEFHNNSCYIVVLKEK